MGKQINNFIKKENCYIINGEFEQTLVFIVIRAGCNNESVNQNGLAHLVEHINLSCEQMNLSSSGFTNFDQTVFKIMLPISVNCLSELSIILNNIIDNSIINTNTFESCKREVLKEYYSLKEKCDQQQAICYFITNGNIQTIPMGIPNDINKLSINDACEYTKKNYNKNNIAIIIASSLCPLDLINTIKPFKVDIQSNKDANETDSRYFKTKNIYYDFLFLTNNNPGPFRVEMYFQKPYKNISLRTKIIRTLFEIMIKDYLLNKVENYILTNILVADKHITEFYYFTDICFEVNDQNMDVRQIQSLIQVLREIKFSEINFNTAVNLISEFTDTPNCDDIKDMFNNLLNNYLYNEPIHITDESYKKTSKILDTLNVEDINKYKKSVLNRSAKIVIINSKTQKFEKDII
ncbi:MAG: insulinase family protein [Oscillospiraceae bacterium]